MTAVSDLLPKRPGARPRFGWRPLMARATPNARPASATSRRFFAGSPTYAASSRSLSLMIALSSAAGMVPHSSKCPALVG